MTRRTILAALAVLVGGCRRAPTEPALPQGGTFTLVDQEGRPFSSEALKGRISLLFFGYTTCPDVCPVTLAKLTAVTNALGKDAARTRVVYVTVDPARDTPAVMKAHLAMYPIEAVGLSGTADAIADVARRYQVRYEVEATTSKAGYFVAHSTMMYVLDAKGRTRHRLRYEATVADVVAAVRDLLD
jgi:protein SCO1/2